MSAASPVAPAGPPSDLSVFVSDLLELRTHNDPLEAAYDEYERRLATGEPVSVSGFVTEYPADLQEPLRKVLAAHELLRSKGYTAEAPNDFAWPEPGESIDGLEVKRELGRGGFGRVYLVWDKNIDRHDVLKLTVGSTEAKLAGPLAHPHIVPILSAPTLPSGVSCIRMPLLGCATLADVLAGAFPVRGTAPASADVFQTAGRRRATEQEIPAPPAPPPDARTYSAAALAVAARLAQGVAFLHRQGIRHRDLKPSNVLINWDGQPVILDFNLAERAATDLPRLGGTLPFMAPEQIQTMLGMPPAGPLDEKCDIFSLGVLLYQLFSGQHPFGVPAERCCTKTRHPNSRAFAAWLLGQHRSGCAELTELDPKLDPAVARLIGQCLAFDPRQRPSAEAVAATLALPDSRTPAARPRRVWWAAAGLVAAVLAGLGIFGVMNREPDASAVVAQAKTELNAGKPEKAEALLDRVVKRDQADAAAFYVRGVARLRQNQYHNAASDFEKAFERGGDPRMLECLTYCYGKAGAPVSCIHRANQAEQLGHATATVLANRAYATLVNGSQERDQRLAMYQSARLDLDRAIAQSANHQVARFIRTFLIVRRAQELKEFNDLPQAEQDIGVAIASGPPAADLYYFAALVRALNRNRPPQAETEILDLIPRVLALGGKPAAFTAGPTFKFLHQKPAFQAALQTPAGPAPDHDVYWSNPVAGPVE